MTSRVPHTLRSLLGSSIRAALAAFVLCVIAHTTVLAQDAQTAAQAVPRVITVTGVFQPVDGQPPRAVETITLALYVEPTGGAPLWQETQNVAVDAKGRYALLLGVTSAEGIPAAVLAAGAEWLGTKFDRPGEVEGARVQLTSVPYTLRAADADTLGGRPASAYLLAPASSDGQATESGRSAAAGSGQTAASASGREPSVPQAVLPGTVNFLSKYVNAADVGDSAVFENLGRVGIGTTTPSDMLHIRFNNPGGTLTGLAVQNLANTATWYSGTLFYDHNGVLGQFQGFNNITHEYRINNVAKNAGAFNDGSINFMIGGASKFFVSPVSVGIGTTAPSPSSNLEVSNAISGSGSTNINVTTYSANAFGPNLLGKKARGTQAAPTAVLNNDQLLNLSAIGYGATGFGSNNSANIQMRATEDWTDTAQGSAINFSTAANGTTTSMPRMTINQNGNVGIGVFGAQANLEVSNSNGASGAGMIFTTTYANGGTSLFVGRRARGTGIAPTAVQNGDGLAAFVGRGRGATSFGGPFGAGMYVSAAENWTDTAQGAALNFNTTPIGATGDVLRMRIDSSGNVGIGTGISALSAPLEISRTGTNAGVVSTVYVNGTDSGSFFVAQTARGTAAAPTAVQAGDLLGAWGAAGRRTTDFSSIAGGVGLVAAENFSDAGSGTAIGLFNTPLGTNDTNLVMALLPSGNVGIGTPADGNGIPTAADRLQVFGDIRVGTSGTNGCVKNFAGTQLTGTCVSDRRFKKNITPFGPVLDRFAALQPVYYNWRASEFPERHFGEAQTYGLVAQDVERVLPDLVVTGGDGFKAIDYSKLPMLTIEAVKELKARNDALQAQADELTTQNQELRDRVEAIERLLREKK